MNQLKLLWNLQEQDEELDQLSNKLNEIEKGEDIEELELKLQQSEYDISNSKTQMDVYNAKITRHSKKVEELNFKSKEIEEKLYSGEITDLNQIKHMNKEIQSLNQLVEELESEILSFMENFEYLKEGLVQLESDQKIYRQELDRSKEARSNNIKELIDIIAEKEGLRTKFMQSIEESLLSEYQSLKASRGRAVIKISDDKCSGCNMNIPLTTVAKLKKNNSINYCDNCDRILLFSKE